MSRVLAVLFLAALFAGCLEDPELDTRLFPCRGPEDCIDGFVCAPERYVCVPAGAPVEADAGVVDGGA